MDSDRSQRARDLFELALRQTGSDRDAFLSATCGDDGELRAEIESLLESSDAANLDSDTAARPKSPLAPGAQLGPYEVVALIDAGGMGEVYKARDTRLNRTVAIKTLPVHYRNDHDRRRRFEREAQAIAALAHAHICVLHDVGQHGDIDYLVMEYLEGETLASRLVRGPLPLDQVVRYAIEIVDAVDKAHRQGIIHRDLKPGNVMVTKSGVKLLDFGLARTRPPVLARTKPTPVTDSITAEGTIVGTLPYMAPEQLEGAPASERSDIFAFGAVVYEMVTGRRAFQGESRASLIAAILEREPPSITSVLPSAPSLLDHVVFRCLAKDPEERWASAHDLLMELQWIRDSGVSGKYQAQPPRNHGLRDLVRRPLQVVVASVVLLAALLVGIGWYQRSSGRGFELPPRLIATADLDILRLTTSGDANSPAIASDGNYFAYVRRQSGRDSLHVRQTATAATTEIVQAEANVTLWGATVSPDGGFVDYIRRVRAQGFELWRVPFLGGPSRLLRERIHSPIGWSPDGRRFAFIRVTPPGTTGVVLVNADGTGERVLAERQRPAQFVSLMIASRPSIAPAWSPDGRLLAIVGAGAVGDPAAGDVSFIDVDTGLQETRGLPSSAVRGLVWFDDTTLVLNATANPGRPLQLHQLSYPVGELNPLTRDVNNYDGISLAADRRTLVSSRREQQIDLAILDPTGKTVAGGPNIAAVQGTTRSTSISWVGDRVLYANWAWTPGSPPQQVLQDAQDTTASADGATLVFTRETSLWTADRNGGSLTRLVPSDAFNPIVTSDSRSVIFVSSQTGLQSPWIVSIKGGEARQLVNRFAAWGIDISPDGTSLAFPSRDEQENRAIVVTCELPGCGRQRITAGPAASRVRWMPDGRAIAYIDTNAPTNIWTVPVSGGAPSQLTRFGDRVIVDFDWSPDGKRLVVARMLETNDIVVLKGLRRD